MDEMGRDTGTFSSGQEVTDQTLHHSIYCGNVEQFDIHFNLKISLPAAVMITFKYLL